MGSKKGYITVEGSRAIVFRPESENLRVACCDCKLVHDVEGEVGDEGEIILRFIRNNRSTAALRRRK